MCSMSFLSFLRLFLLQATSCSFLPFLRRVACLFPSKEQVKNNKLQPESFRISHTCTASLRPSVIFTTSRSDVKRAKPLQIPRNLYLECAQLRRRICYAFADVSVGDASHFPEAGVPSEIGRGYINNNIFNNFMLIFMYNSNLFFHL